MFALRLPGEALCFPLPPLWRKVLSTCPFGQAPSSSRPSAGEFLNICGPLNLELGMSTPGPLSNSFVYSLDLFINSAISSYWCGTMAPNLCRYSQRSEMAVQARSSPWPRAHGPLKMQGAGIRVGHLPGRVARLQHGVTWAWETMEEDLILDRVSFGSLLYAFGTKVML